MESHVSTLRRTVARFAAALVATASLASNATLRPDPSGLWYDANESGWGLTLDQQGNIVFAVLFVYDASGHPAWYVASSIVEPNNVDPLPPPGGPFSGALYRTTGPYFGGAFDPHAVTATQVGTISIGYPDATGENLSVDYTIDGVHVVKTVQRQTWQDEYIDFSGVYQGAAVVDSQAAACPPPPISPALGFVTAFNVAPTFSSHKVRIGWSTGIDTGCTIDGTYRQTGQLAAIDGSLACGAINAPPPASMPATLSGIDFNNGAFTASFRFQQASCTYTGHLGGVRIR